MSAFDVHLIACDLQDHDPDGGYLDCRMRSFQGELWAEHLRDGLSPEEVASAALDGAEVSAGRVCTGGGQR